ncbi:hypothetical protein ACFLW0_01795 [Chloroflexota bacterium]
MKRELRFKDSADEQLTALGNTPALKGVLKQVRKTLGYLETNLKAKSLNIQKYESLTRRYGIPVFEAYIQQNTPGAYRVFWYYGPDEVDGNGNRIPIITVVAITPHP